MYAYTCRHKENYGYGVRLRGKHWMFVPELGQPDSTIHRNLLLDDLVFVNPRDREMERITEERWSRAGIFERLLTCVFGSYQPRTVAGRLLIPYLHGGFRNRG